MKGIPDSTVRDIQQLECSAFPDCGSCKVGDSSCSWTVFDYEGLPEVITVKQLNEILDRIYIPIDCVNDIRQAVKRITEEK